MKIEFATVAILDNGQTLAMSKAAVFVIGHLLNYNDSGCVPHHIAAIKYVRLEHGIGLRESKDIVDYLRDNKWLLRQP